MLEKYLIAVVVDLKAVRMNLVLWVDGNWTQDKHLVQGQDVSVMYDGNHSDHSSTLTTHTLKHAQIPTVLLRICLRQVSCSKLC